MMSKPEMTDRMKKAQEIASNPSQFKVCEGCDSICGASASDCPNCHAYRFDVSPSRVVDQAIYLGARKKTSVTVSDLE
jgi:hypothetical protein